MVRSGSVSYMDDGYVPDYHTGRRVSSQIDQVICLNHAPYAHFYRQDQRCTNGLKLKTFTCFERTLVEDARAL